ncbi:MAG: MFS transporter [Pseudomonadales bacterium]|nr:MFS transporter [Pseudomonadales bacterium]
MEGIKYMRATTAVAAIGTVAVLVFALLPVISGVLASRFALDDMQTGFAATAYFAAYAVITSTSGLWIRRFNWRKVLKLGFAAMIIGLVFCVFAESFTAAQISLALVGVGAGLLFPVSFTIASEMRNTDRVFAIKLTAEQLVPAAMLFLLTSSFLLVDVYANLFLIILLGVIVGSFSIPLVPDNMRRQEDEARSHGSQRGNFRWGLFALVGLLINFAGFAGVWAFLERIASSSSLDPSFTERWIAIGLVTSGVGPLCVAFVGERLDRRVAIAAASTVTVFCLLLLNGETTEFKYAAALFVLPLAFYFSISYMLAIVAEVDYNGKVSSLMSFVLAVGAISGPPLFGYLKSIDGPALSAMSVLLLVGAGLMIAVQTSIQSSRKINVV